MRCVMIRIATVLLWVQCSSAFPAQGERPNILLLTVDSFRPDRIGCYGAPGAHTPNIDKLAGEGVLFTRAFSTASWTNPSLVSMLTGLYPAAHGVERRGQSVPRSMVAPGEAMAGAGIMVPAINYLFPMPEYRYLGFSPSPFLDVNEFLAACRDSTFFGWYHFHGPHLPYSPPEKYKRLFLGGRVAESKALKAVQANILMPRGEYDFKPGEREIVSLLYQAEVAAQDEEIGRVLEVLDSLGLAEKTIVVLTADHGEELFDHGWIGHASTSRNGTLYEEQIHIPLIIRWPGHIPSGRRVSGMVQQVDLMPTLFELIGLPWRGLCQGKSFIRLLDGSEPPEVPFREAVFCQSSICGYQCEDNTVPVWLACVRTGRFKLIRVSDPGGHVGYSFFDLGADPRETRDESGSFPEDFVRLKGLLQAQMFESQRLRSFLLREDSAGTALKDRAVFSERPRVIAPSEGETLVHDGQQGKVSVSWTGPTEGRYVIEYEVGRGKYHLTGSFPVQGNSQVFGPFNRVFWSAFPLYNPWRFRVVPEGKPELAGEWRTFSFK